MTSHTKVSEAIEGLRAMVEDGVVKLENKYTGEVVGPGASNDWWAKLATEENIWIIRRSLAS